MKRKLQLAAVLFGLWPIIILAAQGDREFELSGNGSSDNEFNINNFAASTSLSYYLTDSQEIGLRQGIGVASVEGAAELWNGTTRGFYDFNFPLGELEPFIGVNAGYRYGSRVTDAFVAGPEAGLEVLVLPQTFIVAQAEYQLRFQNVDQVDDAFDNGSLVYTLGIGFDF